jgi:hypothetical protein
VPINPQAPEIHSFIVKIWIEPADAVRRRREWHGQVSHVPDGASHAFRSLRGLTHYINSYLSAAGVIDPSWSIALRKGWHTSLQAAMNRRFDRRSRDAGKDGPLSD